MADLLERTGRLVFLRAHDLGSAYGPPSDQLDVETVFMLDNMTSGAYGFQLRNDDNLPARQAMFDLLRDAFVNNLPVTADYLLEPGRQNGVAIRIALTPNPARPVPPRVMHAQLRGQVLPGPVAGGAASGRAASTKIRRKTSRRR
jgi:hypothetical protein